ncbi:hypothetical protein V2J09_009554 [Rumex salicifolius]
MALLGEDGNGLELARKLESHGIWRSWLGDTLYSNFNHCLSSPASWDAFMRTDETKSRVQIQLQLRVRALLFDKATLSLFFRIPSSPSAATTSLIISKLNPNYLQLHGDDVYFTLEDVQQRDSVVASNTAASKVHAKAASGIGYRYGESEIDSMSHRFPQEDFPETWYSQYTEKYKTSKPYVLSFPNWDSEKRSPSEMFNYLRNLEKHKRRRVAFRVDPSAGFGNSNLENRSNVQLGPGIDGEGSDEETFFPESILMNCVPDIAIAPSRVAEEKQEVEFFGVLDRLPHVATKSPIRIERLGISMDQGIGPTRTKVAFEGNKRQLSHEQALLISKKLISRALATIGFEGASDVPVEVLSQLLSCHICKLGNMLKVLADSYRKKCSAIELVRMFLRVSGHGNLATLAEHMKDGRNVVQQSPQQVQNIPSQLPNTHPNALHMPQVPRPMQSQMQQMMNPHNLTPQQQQLLRMRRAAQVSSPRPAMNMDKDRPMVEVKLENTDVSMDNSAFNMMNSRQQQLQHMRHQQQQQLQQQQLVTPMQRFQAQAGAQYRQLSSLQMAQMQNTNMGVSRAPPVKVEGFSELMGGDSSLKHDSDEGKLTSPK